MIRQVLSFDIFVAPIPTEVQSEVSLRGEEVIVCDT